MDSPSGPSSEEVLSRLRRLVLSAYNRISLYRDKFDSVSIGPNVLRRLSDYASFPLITKEELLAYSRTTGPIESLKGKLYYIGFTTGTTSSPMPVYVGHDDWATWESNLARGFTTAGISKGDIVQITLGRWGIGSQAMLCGVRRTGAAVLPIEVDAWKTMEWPERLSQFHVTWLFTTPSIIRQSLLNVVQNGPKLPRHLKGVVLVGETWSEDFRDEVKRVLGVEVYDFYGSTEAGMVGSECPAHSGLHCPTDQVLVEILDPDTHDPASNGDAGEVVVTTLWRKAFPLLRYRTGDIAQRLEGECPCGSPWPRISRVKTRFKDEISIGSTKIHQSLIEEAVLESLGASYTYQVVLSSEKGKDILSISIEVPKGLVGDATRTRLLSERLRNIQEDFAGLVGAGIILPPTVRFVTVGSLERKGGKVRKVVDSRLPNR